MLRAHEDVISASRIDAARQAGPGNFRLDDAALGSQMTREARGIYRMRYSSLRNTRVVDLTHHIAGPYATRCWPQVGADVIKVEPPWGEGARKAGPHRPGQTNGDRGGRFAFLNTNKLGVTLNLKHPRGVELLMRMLDGADLLIENFAPGTLARLGLAPDGFAEAISEVVGHLDIEFRRRWSRSRCADERPRAVRARWMDLSGWRARSRAAHAAGIAGAVHRRVARRDRRDAVDARARPHPRARPACRCLAARSRGADDDLRAGRVSIQRGGARARGQTLRHRPVHDRDARNARTAMPACNA